MVDTLILESDERNIGGWYNTVKMMDCIKAQLDWVVSRVSRSEGNREGGIKMIRDVEYLSQDICMLWRGSCKVCHEIGSSPRSLPKVLLLICTYDIINRSYHP